MSALPLASARLSKLWILFFSGFQTRLCHMSWFYPYRSFKHSKWWRHKLGHT